MAVIPEHHDETDDGGGDLPEPVSAGPDGRRRVVRRIAISAGAAAGYGALLLVAFSGVPELPTALGPRPVPAPQLTSRPPTTTQSTTTPPSTTPPAATTGEPRPVSPPASRGTPEPVHETPYTSATSVPVRATAVPAPPAPPDPPDTRAATASPPPSSDRRNGRGHGDPPGKAKTTPPKSGR
ncbi:hypothetical protein [Amycolatopsis sp. cmx-4-54]|uniref:hypothetical protein n=1 Tax=Amycolatopsis sp. cmx-4-54 TaxID=2790936 RepID=UPI00397BC457